MKGTVKTLKPSLFYFTIAINKQGQEIKLFRPARMIKHGSD